MKLAQVAPIMRKAIVSIEDDRFYQHGALDAKGTLRALIRNQSDGGVSQGGSSITQQFVKLSLIEKARTPEEVKAATAETYQRKIAELRYAVAVEKQFSKDEILEKYLNLANFGDGAYGIEAAARHYFSTTAAKLTLPQAAMLAGLVKNPSGYDPTNYPKRGKDRSGRKQGAQDGHEGKGPVDGGQRVRAREGRAVHVRLVPRDTRALPCARPRRGRPLPHPSRRDRRPGAGGGCGAGGAGAGPAGRGRRRRRRRPRGTGTRCASSRRRSRPRSSGACTSGCRRHSSRRSSG